MNSLHKAAQQGLEALETRGEHHPRVYAAIIALRVALESPVEEPVAWRTFDGEGGYDYTTYDDDTADYAEKWNARNPNHKNWVEPLYTAPPQMKPLTDEEMRECAGAMDAEPLDEGWPELIKFARAIEKAHGIGVEE